MRGAAAVLLGLVLVGCGAQGGSSGSPPAPTACGFDGGGRCPSLGHGAVRPVAARRIGLDQEVDLNRFFTVRAVTTPRLGLGPGGGLDGAAFPASLFPSSGTLTLTVAGDETVSFLVPAWGAGRPSAVSLAVPRTIPVPPGRYGTMWLLEAAVPGNVGPLPVALRYADGAQAEVPVTFGDWCDGGLPMADAPPEYVGIAVSRVLVTRAGIAAGDLTGAVPASPPRGAPGLGTYRADCGLWAEAVALPTVPSPLVAVTIPAQAADADPAAFFMAMTLVARSPLGS
jgi:hypothetical protein